MSAQQIEQINTDLIDPSPYQVRQRFDPESLQRLADDIRLNGLLNPILCRPMNGRYEIMHGERRWRASKLIQWATITTQIRDATDIEARRICAAENIQRADLTAVETTEWMIEWLDACLVEFDDYDLYGETPHQRVSYLLGKMWNDQRNETDFFTYKFISKIEEVFKSTNRGIQWDSFYNNDLRVYLNLDDDVKGVAIDKNLNKSQTKALQGLKSAAPEQFEHIKETGSISLGLFVKEEVPIEETSARELRQKAQHAVLENERALRIQHLPAPPPPTGKYSVIYADPPWSYDNSGFFESAASQYPTMSTDDICALPIKELATSTTVLFLWATNPLLEDALQVLKAWGFDYKTNIAWVKDRGRGRGWFLRSRHELLLIGTRAETPHPEYRPDSCFMADRPPKHSKKPDKAYGLIERMYPTESRIELFARNQRPGWDSWGNEVIDASTE